LDRKPWPDTEYVASRLKPHEGQKGANYIDSLGQLALSAFFAEPGASIKERLPNPWRAQFLIQEVLDQVAGRYFSPRAPSPEEVFDRQEFHNLFRTLMACTRFG
jgi:hypothetical protein